MPLRTSAVWSMILIKGRTITILFIFLWCFAWCSAQLMLQIVFPSPVGRVKEKQPCGKLAFVSANLRTSLRSLFILRRFFSWSSSNCFSLFCSLHNSLSGSNVKLFLVPNLSKSKCLSVSRLSASTRELYNIRTNSSCNRTSGKLRNCSLLSKAAWFPISLSHALQIERYFSFS